MVRKVIVCLALSALLSTVGPASWAQTVTHRQANQNQRIHQGAVSGTLTQEELESLRRKQQAIQRAKRRAWEDGRLTPGERTRLSVMQNQAGDDIYDAKHNDEERE